MLGLHLAIFSLQCQTPWEDIAKAAQGLHVHPEQVKVLETNIITKAAGDQSIQEILERRGRKTDFLDDSCSTVSDGCYSLDNYRKSYF